MELCSENDGYMVVHSMREAKRIEGLAELIGLKLRLPITYDEFINPKPMIREFPLYVDNVEMLLDHIARRSRCKIDGVSGDFIAYS